MEKFNAYRTLKRINESTQSHKEPLTESEVTRKALDTAVNGTKGVVGDLLFKFAKGVDQINRRKHLDDEELEMIRLIKEVANSLDDTPR